MSVTDPIADYLTRIRNAIKANQKKVEIPSSHLKREITRILKEKKYIIDYIEKPDNKSGILVILLKYNAGKSVINGLKRISKPGLRVYKKADELPKVLGGLGIAIISTPKGIMTDQEARQEKVGGEIICHIW